MIRSCFLHKSKSIKFLTERLKITSLGEKLIDWSLCKKCGLIYQSNTISKKEMNRYYSNNITHFDDRKKPSLDKIYNTNRQVNIIKDNLLKFPKSVLEVSLLNDYNLKQYKKNGSRICEGLEPSKQIAEKINKKKIFKVYDSTIEKFKFKKKYDLIVISHVLEHLFNPLSILKKCNKNQKINQYVLLEVPLFESLKRYPNGSLMLEHLNYFNEYNFTNLILSSGYEPVYISKIAERTLLPFITILAKKTKNKKFTHQDNLNFISYKKQLKNLDEYLKINRNLWKNVEKKFNNFKKTEKTLIYGSGLHASLLLSYTNIEKKFNIVGFLDSAKSKKNKKIGNYKIDYPEISKIDKKTNIIIASSSSEKEIYKSLERFRKKGIKTYCLYS